MLQLNSYMSRISIIILCPADFIVMYSTPTALLVLFHCSTPLQTSKMRTVLLECAQVHRLCVAIALFSYSIIIYSIIVLSIVLYREFALFVVKICF